MKNDHTHEPTSVTTNQSRHSADHESDSRQGESVPRRVINQPPIAFGRAPILTLQRTAGNRAVTHLLSRHTIQRQLSMIEVMKIKSPNVKKRVVGDKSYTEIITQLTTAAEVENLFVELQKQVPELFTVAVAETEGFKHKVTKSKKEAAEKTLATILPSLLAAAGGGGIGNTPLLGPQPAPAVIGAPLVIGVQSVGGGAMQANTNERPVLTDVQSKSGGTTNHGTYNGPKGTIKRGADMLNYVKANHASSEEVPGPNGGVQYSLNLGVKTGTQEIWYITYYVNKSNIAIVTHFGPFGDTTGGNL